MKDQFCSAIRPANASFCCHSVSPDRWELEYLQSQDGGKFSRSAAHNGSTPHFPIPATKYRGNIRGALPFRGTTQLSSLCSRGTICTNIQAISTFIFLNYSCLCKSIIFTDNLLSCKLPVADENYDEDIACLTLHKSYLRYTGIDQVINCLSLFYCLSNCCKHPLFNFTTEN